MRLVYQHPAKDENEATPLGNGHIGLWAYRDGEKETIHLNEGTFWSGGPKDPPDSHFFERMQRSRELLLKGKYKEGDRSMSREGKRINTEEFDPLGDLIIRTPGEKPGLGILDMEKGMLTVDNTLFKRQYFVSYPDRVFVIHLKGEAPSDFRLEFFNKNEGYTECGEKMLVAYGNAIHDGMAFCLAVRVLSDGAVSTEGDLLRCSGATEATLIGTVITGFSSWNEIPEKDGKKLLPKAKERLEKACEKGYEQLLKAHIADYTALFEKNSLVFGEKQSDVYPEIELKKKTPSEALITAYYEFSKYLTISASRSDSQAMNLQGLWNKNINPPWRSNYTININTQMNYWFPDCADLSECFLPFENLVSKISVSGEKVAKMMHADGFASFHNTDLWGFCTSVDEATCYSFFPLAGVWMTCELMNHYRYTLDKAYLKRIYPIIKKCCEFVLSFLVEKDGEWVTVPSTSPEHKYRIRCKTAALTVASTCDMFLCRQLFDDLTEGAAILGVDEEYASRVQQVKQKLHKPTTDKKGRLDEFHHGTKEEQKGHRHFSHLIGTFPLMQVGYYHNKEYINAVNKSLQYRLKHGSGYTGWSCGWALNLLEMTHDSDFFAAYVRKLFNDSTYPNMLDKHPPFQIDGNFGAGRAFAGAVAISENNVIEFFPVKIPQNKKGEVKNLRLYGGYKVSFRWDNHKVKSLSVYSETSVAVSFRNQDDGSIVTYPVKPKEYTEIEL